ncbi:MAG: hypothetical protein ABW208_02870 [Pyrinomonadaceae bacterium]
MNTNPKARLSRSRRPPPCLLFLVLVGAVCVAAAAANTHPELFPAGAAEAVRRDANQVESEALAANARAALERMPPESRLETIEDAGLRRATQATYRAVAELAGNREAAHAPALHARFLRTYSTFETEARRGHATCALNCKAYDEAACRKECKTSNRKLCGCKLITFGCVVAECLF